LSTCFSLRDVYRKHWGLLEDKDTIQNACDELVEAGWLRLSNDTQAFGRPRSLFYQINPKVKIKKVFDENSP